MALGNLPFHSNFGTENQVETQTKAFTGLGREWDSKNFKLHTFFKIPEKRDSRKLPGILLVEGSLDYSLS